MEEEEETSSLTMELALPFPSPEDHHESERNPKSGVYLALNSRLSCEVRDVGAQAFKDQEAFNQFPSSPPHSAGPIDVS